MLFAVLPGVPAADVVDAVWMRRYAQPGYCHDEATAMSVDAAGNVYVTGSSQRFEQGPEDFATVKHNSAGVQQWAERFAGPGNSVPSAIAVDGAGNAAVCGYVDGGATSNDWTAIGYSPAGARRFVTSRTSPGGNPDEANSIVADPRGNYYVAGRHNFLRGMDDATVVKYNSVGAEQWLVHYDGPLSGEGAVAICRDATGDLYATGWSVNLQDNADVLTMKVSAAGSLVWTKRYTAPEGGNDLGLRIAHGANGRVYAVGSSHENGSGLDMLVLCLDAIPPGVEEQSPRPQAPSFKLEPTVVRGVLNVRPGTRSGLSDNPVMSRAVLVDASDRKLLTLRPGPNDVRHLAPGVYFIRPTWSSAGRELPAICRAVIAQ